MTNKEMLTYDMMVEYGVATPEELNLARNIMNGSWTEVLNAVCFARTGFRNFETYLEYEMEE